MCPCGPRGQYALLARAEFAVSTRDARLHNFKYRLAFVVRGECVLRYDNESGKGDHRHYKGRESSFAFESPEKLVAAFQRGIARYRRENRDA